MEKSAVHIFVRGRVQGVWFRASAREKANDLNLAGWARNCSDGSVEIHAEGDKSSLEEFITWCRLGPAAASVSSIDLDWVPSESMVTFAIH